MDYVMGAGGRRRIMERKRIRIFPEHLGPFPYIWLIWWGSSLLYLSINVSSFGNGLPGILLHLLFLYFYRQAYWHWGIRWWIDLLGQALIAIALSFLYHPGYLNMASYVAAFLGNLPSLRQMILTLGGFISLTFLPYLLIFSPSWEEFVGSGVLGGFVTMLTLPFFTRFLRRWIMMNHQLKEANQQMERLTRLAERERIARDLHDTLGHTLSMIILKSELSERLVRLDPDKAVHEISDVENAAREALKQVRELVSNMYTTSVEEEVHQGKELLAAAGISPSLPEGGSPRLPSLTNTILALCLRESITNVVKHSRADRCSIYWRESPERVDLIVEDDGIGMGNLNVKEKGRGILGMRERLELIGGTLRIHTKKGEGTKVIFSVPVKKGGSEG